ncbi:MAG: undecaprenyldiphospho-muramoylpentapeptide beta-N-acetylglucosaminyltransferase [Desulfovibrionaceae bacterium]|nr:undecaprenyldiphospho-muramoylpentapeptide beta-N-acetylglucosaminyltransferase [Desulfovibrionaceae bacterium]
MRKIILTTGGTGGHIFPALAVAKELMRVDPTIEILFVGSLYGPEKELVEREGLAFHGFPVRGFLGRGMRSIGAAFHMFGACAGAISLLRAYRPNVVAGFGGYASCAALTASYVLGIPRVLHEQNAVPGMSNRLMGKIAKKICVSLPATEGFAEQKCLYTGNPVREAVVRAGMAERSFQTRNLLVLGGSQGAHALNTFMCENIARFSEAGIAIVHQTGKADEKTVSEVYRAHGYPDTSVRAFIDDMPAVYTWADLALCRSGASTLCELCACGLPSILVPFPHAIHDHQTKNAKVLTDAGAALMVQEAQIGKSVELAGLILDLFQNQDDRAQLSHNAKKIARPDAAAQVAQVILQEADAS